MQPSFQHSQQSHSIRLASLHNLQMLGSCANDDDNQPAAPRMYRATDNAMQPCGIRSGDMLSIQHRQPRSGETVLARLNGRLLVRRLRQLAGQTMLLADQPEFAPCYVLEGDQLELIGVVSGRFRL